MASLRLAGVEVCADRFRIGPDMSASVPGPATRELLGCPIHALTLDQTLAEVDRAIRTRRRLRIGVVNAAKLVNMRRNAELREDVLSSDLILADGMSVVWAARLLGRPLPERVAGIDLMQEMLRAGNELGYRVYCLGATRGGPRGQRSRESRVTIRRS